MKPIIYNIVQFAGNKIVAIYNFSMVAGFLLRVAPDRSTVGWLTDMFPAFRSDYVAFFLVANFVAAGLYMLLLRRATIWSTIWGLGPMFFYCAATIVRFINDTESSAFVMIYPLTDLVILTVFLIAQHIITLAFAEAANLVVAAVEDYIDHHE